MKKRKKIKLIFSITLFLGFLIGIVIFYSIKNNDVNTNKIENKKNENNIEFIDVKLDGAVKYDLNFLFKKGATMREILFKASILPNADLSNINLETKVFESKKIFVPFIKAEKNVFDENKKNKIKKKKNNENNNLNKKYKKDNPILKNNVKNKNKNNFKFKKNDFDLENEIDDNSNNYAIPNDLLEKIKSDEMNELKINKNILKKIIDFLEKNKGNEITWKNINSIHGVGPKTIEKLQKNF
ncbi:hypothetical protein [[Mycoplasma] collis]|uniref:hypothetical protein n=1 Tax=[Mycoplasma] collis TaxID=2127 RepID=UPI00051B0512|nr:hypothetical protein [[Mycoplasma] collis]